MQVGSFQLISGEFRGELRTLTIRAELVFVPVYGVKGSVAPSHVIQCNGVEVGAAWRADTGGGKGLKVRIDDPTFPTPLMGDLTPEDEGPGYVLTWRRAGWRG